MERWLWLNEWHQTSAFTFASNEFSLSLKTVIRLQLKQPNTKTENKFHCLQDSEASACSLSTVKAHRMISLGIDSPVRAGGRRSVDGFLTASWATSWFTDSVPENKKTETGHFCVLDWNFIFLELEKHNL